MTSILANLPRAPFARIFLAAASLLCGALPALAGGSMLPPGYLSTRGAQIVDDDGNPVRIAAIGWNGADGSANAPQGLELIGYQTTMRQMVSAGFNAIRFPFSDRLLTERPAFGSIDPIRNPDLVGLSALQMLDRIVDYAGKIGLKVILDHHNNEGGAKPYRMGGQQQNGLWFDRGPGSSNEDAGDGSGTPGRVSAEDFQRNWVSLARRYAGNPTVIGFDLHNEPTTGLVGNGINWGNGGPADLHAMCTEVGTAIQAVNSGPLIICEGFQDYAAGLPDGDLRGVAALPVVLPVAGKVVYSVHEFPAEISNYRPDAGPAAIARMNTAWGYLVATDTAPVFVGEMGSSMLSGESQTWAATLLSYMNGTAPGGPRFHSDQQPVSGCWWAWGALPGEVPQGVLKNGWQPATNGFHANQMAVWQQLLFTPRKRTVQAAPPVAARAFRLGMTP